MRFRTIITTVFPIATALAVGATSFTSPTIYSSPWWYFLWAAIGLCVITSLLNRKIRQHKSLAGLHFSLLLIIAGGGITALTSTRGTIRLKAGLSTDSFIAKDGTEYRLPTTLTMLSLDMEYYPGMTFPRDFKTVLSTAYGDTVEISMNHIGHIHPYKRPWDDYRIYQTSYSDDGSSILTVVRDPSGIALTYAGYILFIVCGMWQIISSSGLSFLRFSRKSATIFLTLTATCGMSATESDISSVSTDSLINCQVMFRGHAMPFETMARKVSLTLTGAEHVAGMDASNFLASLITAPSEWENVPLLRIKDKALRKALGINRQPLSLSALYSDEGVYNP
ncbi:MAG: cytochrome c biogenesis protein ResB, partial [Muribaculaceae bacterium]|nr:cytochrome c biogenesis protein ResB [Muribaculaceae bacterium]